ncbi:riboflavin synthase [Clostridium sp. Marseille-P2415]|uniref:riboflavin synthase n=1 Tax=Clostridium sp. Marseille-P2415 TaxID=1805471 RepID=UPI0009883ED0|nr:riboflavin synthase [Clostridium sp. Marseille-P2415]
MFTGIIDKVGIILEIKRNKDSAVLTIDAGEILDDGKVGDSIAVNGVCLTVNSIHGRTFSADVMHETMRRTSLAALEQKSPVNLERALALGGRFGGHIVAGHVDGTGIISGIKKDDNAIWFTIRTTPSILRYVVEKGSIAVDGISLTVAAVSEEDFKVSVIPHTLGNTTLAFRKAGDMVNLENDCIGKYVERLLGIKEEKTGITRDFLEKYGY